MIKITKDLSAIPDSLQIPSGKNFPTGIPSPPKTTHKRRLELMRKGEYINEDKFNNRYKQQDVKDALKNIYHGKCAFCEQKIEQSHVEHYRPKTSYYWLAFSWDNLLFSCATCNTHKGKSFAINGTPVNCSVSLGVIKNINSISVSYDAVEKPQMVNPEVTDPAGKIQFNKKGGIQSVDPRFSDTIGICKINRTHLNDERRKLLDDFRNDIRSILVADSLEAQRSKIDVFTRQFIRNAKDKNNQFLGFRKFVLSNGWLNDITKGLRSS